MAPALLALQEVSRSFPAGEGRVTVLHDIDLSIEAGEMVAIMGPSGSGKSTLMNILGCLDRPTLGIYTVAGTPTAQLEPDALARLRREHFGFVFQRYQLLVDLDALANVEMPAVYAGITTPVRHERARALLEQLGLAGRMGHRPGQLSGGQQQRVSIARALMNGGDVILADEPTGALDHASGQEVMKILQDLHTQGHTIVLVTHDAEVAEHAQRIIELRDGRIVADRRRQGAMRVTRQKPDGASVAGALQALASRFGEAARMAWRAMAHHRLRTLLTMLGIIIGIASVVLIAALGAGTRQRLLDNLSFMGTNSLSVYPGGGGGDRRAESMRSLKAADADALAQLEYVDSVTPEVAAPASLRYRNIDLNATVNGVGERFFRAKGYRLVSGSVFDREGVRRQAQEGVIDEQTRKALFPDDSEPLGAVITLGNMPVRIVGVVTPPAALSGDSRLNVWVPYTVALHRLMGQSHLNSITLRARDDVSSAAAEQGVRQLLTQRHGRMDFYVMNSDRLRELMEQSGRELNVLMSSIAVISLVVGGIGVMNIMLVSVTERTQEIGVRMAVGARQSDILQQFLIEAVLVCLLGGLLGGLLALAAGKALSLSRFAEQHPALFSPSVMLMAFASSTLIGVVFGFLPARNAARLDPVDALSRT